MGIPPIKKSSKEAMEEIFIPPVRGYKASVRYHLLPSDEGEMMDKIRRDSKDFPRWMEENGGYHYDEKLGRFVGD